jgi:subfamily B ATP-binding cassette protein MsbA
LLFNDTVRSNIAYGRPHLTDAEVTAAARTADAEGFIRELPDGYGTLVGERGVRLSGGERQRIAIARAIADRPPILIFDEATSALDNRSERLVQAAMDRAMRDRTVIIVAHRLTTLRHADRIFVIDDGRIAESGTHEELIERGGRYRRLYDAGRDRDAPIVAEGASSAERP